MHIPAERMRQVPSLKFVDSNEAFYVYINTQSIDRDMVDFSEELLENHQVAAFPGTAHIFASHLQITSKPSKLP